MPDFRILAIGSPHGDDQIAWCVADRLIRESPFRDRTECVASPWAVLDHLDASGPLIIIDACRSGA